MKFNPLVVAFCAEREFYDDLSVLLRPDSVTLYLPGRATGCVRPTRTSAYVNRQTHSQQEPERLNTLNTVTVSTRRVNKIAFVLLCFFLGGFGVDRFMRGQVGLGIFKFLIGSWATLGIWPLVDFIIALVKLGKYQDEFVFDNAGKWVEPAAH
jgi:TM2 domain-containing membrane protein YozV